MSTCGQIEEMTERDWCIFCEDFNISYKVSLLYSYCLDIMCLLHDNVYIECFCILCYGTSLWTDLHMAMQGSRIPRPMRYWEEGALSPELLKAVQKVGYKKPSPIQMAAIPIGLQQRDVIGIAETGIPKSPSSFLSEEVKGTAYGCGMP